METKNKSFHALLARMPVGVISTMAIVLFGILLFMPESAAEPGQVQNGIGVTVEGRVLKILEEETIAAGPNGTEQTVQRIQVEITEGERQGHAIEIEHGAALIGSKQRRVKEGDRVLVEYTQGPAGENWYISDFVRLPSLAILFLLFSVAAIAVGRSVGVRSLISMLYAVLVILFFILPHIAAGQDPVVVAIVGSLLALAPSLYLTYSWNWKTHSAFLGMTISLFATSALAFLFVGFSHLTGFASEESALLAFSSNIEIDMQGLALAGIIIGTVGVLDDVTVSQASAIFELNRANPALKRKQLFDHGMTIGRDHIASMVNTLMMAYVGAALPFFLLLVTFDAPLTQTLNREFLAEEIIRTLVGSLGLILAVPITSLIASVLVKKEFRSH